MKIYIFNPEPKEVDNIPPQLGAEVPIAIVADGKAVVVEGEWRSVKTPDEAGRIKLLWGWYYDIEKEKVFLNVNNAPDPLLAYIVVKQEAGTWQHDWVSGRLNVYFRPSELGDAARTRAKFARVAEKRRKMVEELRENPRRVMEMLTSPTP